MGAAAAEMPCRVLYAGIEVERSTQSGRRTGWLLPIRGDCACTNTLSAADAPIGCS
jgi:hypothetical protein